MQLDLIAVGETMLAFAPAAGESVRSASRLLIDHAGAESNTCVGLARLGFRVAWVSRLGADAAGDRILDALGAEGPGSIDTRWVLRDASRPTGMMLKEPRPRSLDGFRDTRRSKGRRQIRIVLNTAIVARFTNRSLGSVAF